MGNSSSKTISDGIESAELDNQGNLIFKKSNNSILGPFKVKGEPGVGITDANINSDGVLKLTLSDGKSFDFQVKGKDGINGIDGKNGRDGVDGKNGGRDGNDGMTGPPGPPGPPGKKGDTGVGISNATINGEGVLKLTLTDGKTFDFQVKAKDGINGKDGIQGLKGDQGIQGLQGLKGDQGIQGIQGIPGNGRGGQGPKGDQGIQGPRGEQGPKGDAGTIPGLTPERIAKAVNVISGDADWTRIFAPNQGTALFNGLSTDHGINVGDWSKAPVGRLNSNSISIAPNGEHVGDDWKGGLNIKNGNGHWTHFNSQNSSMNYIRGDTIVNGQLRVDTICASDGNHCVNISDIVNKNGRYTVENVDGRRLQMSGDGARAVNNDRWGNWEQMRFYN